MIDAVFKLYNNLDLREEMGKKNIEDAYNNHDNEAMLNMGWNPYIKPTAEAFKRAYERQMEFFEENYSYNPTIEKQFSNQSNDLFPIYFLYYYHCYHVGCYWRFCY